VFAGRERFNVPGDGGLPVGIFSTSVYPTNRCVLPPDATVVLYTDGLIEARRGTAQIRESGLARMVARHLDKSGQQLADALVRRARRYGGQNLADDMVVVVAKLH